jgi:small conductance mechanosensitive channel
MHNRNRRVHIQISVPYKSDYRKASELIIEEIKKNNKILQDPAPTVTVDSFANNAVNFDIGFWVPDLSEVSSLRNEVMLNIFEGFSKNGINM